MFELFTVVFRRELSSKLLCGRFSLKLRNYFPKKSFTSSIYDKIRLILAGQFDQVDWKGLFALWALITCWFVIRLLLPAFMETYEIDPATILMLIWWSPGVVPLQIFKIAYGCILMYTFQLMLCPARVFLISGLGMARLALVLPGQLYRMGLCDLQLHLYI